MARFGLLLRASPTLLLALLFLPSWLEPALGRYFLGLGLGFDVLFSSLETAYLFVDSPLWGLPPPHSPRQASLQISSSSWWPPHQSNPFSSC